MMNGFFLGVAASLEAENESTKDYFWCMPPDSKIGDKILLYCPRSASASRQGVFAEAVVESSPDKACDKNYFCSGYGAYGAKYMYVRIKILKRFKPHVLAKEMKADRMLSGSGFVRRNFQGTTFILDKAQFDRILTIAERKANILR